MLNKIIELLKEKNRPTLYLLGLSSLIFVVVYPYLTQFYKSDLLYVAFFVLPLPIAIVYSALVIKEVIEFFIVCIAATLKNILWMVKFLFLSAQAKEILSDYYLQGIEGFSEYNIKNEWGSVKSLVILGFVEKHPKGYKITDTFCHFAKKNLIFRAVMGALSQRNYVPDTDVVLKRDPEKSKQYTKL